MPEKCTYCGKEFANTKALGSHIHYLHETNSWPGDYILKDRSERDKERFQNLLGSCLEERDLPKLRETEKIEEAIVEIPPGVSNTLDKYRKAFQCARTKEELLKHVEKLIRESEDNEAE